MREKDPARVVDAAALVAAELQDFEDSVEYGTALEFLQLAYHHRYAESELKAYEKLQTIREICMDLAEHPEALARRGEQLYRSVRPIVDAWLEIVDVGEKLNPAARSDLVTYQNRPTAENLVKVMRSATSDLKDDLIQPMVKEWAELLDQWVQTRGTSANRAV